MLFRVVAPYFVAGVEVVDGFVVEAPPIVRYMMGWPQNKLLNYSRVKNWKLEALENGTQ